MYSALLLSDLVNARCAARLAEAERRRQLREFATARPRRQRFRRHLPWPRYACVTVR